MLKLMLMLMLIPGVADLVLDVVLDTDVCGGGEGGVGGLGLLAQLSGLSLSRGEPVATCCEVVGRSLPELLGHVVGELDRGRSRTT